MPIIRLISMFVVLAFSILPAAAQSAAPSAEWINALRQGGYVIIFRHGATHNDQADTDPLNPDNVAKQRQLNDAGRAKHKEIGEVFRKLQIKVSAVQTSKFYRAIETGKLMFPDLTPQPSIDLAEVGQVNTPIENNRRRSCIYIQRVITLSTPRTITASICDKAVPFVCSIEKINRPIGLIRKTANRQRVV